jgi:small-conductance mechanosensitive channel
VQRNHEQQVIPGTVSCSGRRRRRRPFQAIIAFVLAVAAAFAVSVAGIPVGTPTAPAHSHVSVDVGHMITTCGATAFFVLALMSAFAFARWARPALDRFIGVAYGAIVRYVMILIGVCVVTLTTLSLLGFRVTQLVVGGAVTGVLITIAAQQSLSNLFAGVMLQFARPFKVGDLVQVRSGALAGTIEGTVSEFNITYVRLETGQGRVFLPNSQVLAAAVSPMRVNGSSGAPGDGELAS